MTFDELLQNRRSIRDFEDKAVPRDMIEDIIRDSIQAPSATNRQPWLFSIIHNKDLMQRISDASKHAILNDIEKDPSHSMKDYEDILSMEDFNVFFNAPCLVCIVGPQEEPLMEADCALAACYFMFSATARGLGTCWIGLGAELREQALRLQLGIPDGHRIYAPIIIGYPREIPSLPERNPPRILKVIQEAVRK